MCRSASPASAREFRNTVYKTTLSVNRWRHITPNVFVIIPGEGGSAGVAAELAGLDPAEVTRTAIASLT